MEHNVQDLKEALAARSQTATLDELKSRGRRSVKVIRADDIAQMIEAAVSHTIAKSGMMSAEEVEQLEERSREQFQTLLERRQAEILELRQAAEELNSTRAELNTVREHEAAARIERDDLRTERDAIAARLRRSETQREQMVAATRAIEAQRDEALLRVRSLESELAKAQAETPATVASGMNADIVYRLMGEIAELKAKSAPQPLAVANGNATADALAGALQQLTSSFTAKLESIGRKMGVSSAVEADAPSLTNLFKHQDTVKLESNMENLTVKAKSATGIAANLERLKKLKGG
jgi:hypothetical protein